MSTCCVPGIMLSAGDTTANKPEAPPSMQLAVWEHESGLILSALLSLFSVWLMEYLLSFLPPVHVYGCPHTLCFPWQLIAGSNLAGSLLPAPFYRWGSGEFFILRLSNACLQTLKLRDRENVVLYLRTQNSDHPWSSAKPQTELPKKLFSRYN